MTKSKNIKEEKRERKLGHYPLYGYFIVTKSQVRKEKKERERKEGRERKTMGTGTTHSALRANISFPGP